MKGILGRKIGMTQVFTKDDKLIPVTVVEVPSNVVMAKSDGTLPFCGNQNIFPAFIEGNAIARGYAATQYDETISWYFTDAAYQYADGYLDKDSAIQAFKTKVSDNLSF